MFLSKCSESNCLPMDKSMNTRWMNVNNIKTYMHKWYIIMYMKGKIIQDYVLAI